MPQDYSTTEISKLNYEDDILIQNYREAQDAIDVAMQMPTFEQVRIAYAKVNKFAKGLVYKKTMDKYAGEIRPTLADIEVILYGDQGSRSMQTRAKYEVRLDRDRHGSITLSNAPVIIQLLDKVTFIVKQLAYDEGFLAKKPWERATGLKAINASAEQ